MSRMNQLSIGGQIQVIATVLFITTCDDHNGLPQSQSSDYYVTTHSANHEQRSARYGGEKKMLF